ncbi:MAG: phosphopyruvate hydratase, partial [Actinomycetota bacterium]
MTPTEIRDVFAWEALDSRGKPTVGCVVTLAGGARGEAIVPSGASIGSHEAVELRDGQPRYGGLGVTRAVSNLAKVIGPAIAGMDAADSRSLDAAMCDLDGTPALSRLGANAVLAASIAGALAAAQAQGLPLYQTLDPQGPPLLPLPMSNMISGGAHAAGAVDLQDFLAIPIGAGTFSQAIEWCWRVRRGAVEIASEEGLPAMLVADEGGLGAPLGSNREALDLLARSIRRSGLRPGEDVSIGIDVAATQLVAEGRYFLAREDRYLEAAEWIAELEEWTKLYPIVSVEDPHGEDDWEGWRKATDTLGHIQLLGDDLFATNSARLKRGIEEGVANAVLVKPNQAGTLSRAAQVVEHARSAGYASVVSARSGDTEDHWLADLAVGWRAGQIKVGSLTRSERTSKWNRLLRIEKEHRGEAIFAGRG